MKRQLLSSALYIVQLSKSLPVPQGFAVWLGGGALLACTSSKQHHSGNFLLDQVYSHVAITSIDGCILNLLCVATAPCDVMGIKRERERTSN